jgi:FKBP-type peptidyl-prolyl cis-trans isomerase FklB
MKLRVVGVLLASLAFAPLASAQDATELKTAKDKVSYGFGLNVGRSMVRDGLQIDDIDFNLLVQGLRDALNNKPLQIEEKEFQEAFETVIAPKLAERAKAAADKNKKEGDAFLAANKGKPGVKATASGLQYKVLKAGEGKTPAPTDIVRTTYEGKLIDGTVFDKSEQPVEFPVNGVIKGWTEALQLMKEGAKLELYVPANLAYGERGVPPTIPPHSVLVFQVELLEVADAEADAEAAPPAPKRRAQN